MAESDGREQVKRALRLSRLADSFSVLLKGNVAQRALVLVGAAMIVLPIVFHWEWGLVMLGGWLFCFLGLRDYERDRALREGPARRPGADGGPPSEGGSSGDRDHGR